MIVMVMVIMTAAAAAATPWIYNFHHRHDLTPAAGGKDG